MSSRSILGLVYILDELRRIGEDVEPVLARYGLDPDKLDPAAEISRGLELRVLAEVAERLRDPLAGLKAGASFSLAGYGPFTMLLMTCENAWEAFRTGVRYQELTYLFGQLGLEPGERATALTLTPVALPEPGRRFRIDGEMSGTFQLIRDMQVHLGVDLNPEAVEVPYPSPPEAQAYEAHYRAPVHFGSDMARFWMPNDYLSLPFPTANRTAHEMYRTQCDQLLARRREEEAGLADQVLMHLELFQGDFPDAAGVAGVFGLGERSLRRRLSEEGTSFRKLLERVRFRKARQLLEATDRPVEAIAHQLGYAESAAFIHAFKRWAGQSPAAWRRDQGR